MTFITLVRVTALTTILAAAATTTSNAQTPSIPMGTPDSSARSGLSDMTGGHMISPGMGGGYNLKMIFAIVDANGDGALSFDEIMAIHKRVFDAMDANKDGKVAPEEMQRFMQPN